MARPKKRPVYVILAADILGSVGKDRVLNIDSDPLDHLLDELQCPLADQVLIALRKAFHPPFPGTRSSKDCRRPSGRSGGSG